jgi:hypothetical protein
LLHVVLTLFFAPHQTKKGLVCLDQAVASGHKAAAYVLGLLLYTLEDGGYLAKWHIGQVEGDVGRSKVATEKTNRECRKYRWLAANAVQEVAWKGTTGSGRSDIVPVLPEDGHRCTSACCAEDLQLGG